jgi:predicted nuclease of restriction endonuclease-like (RecB) superfamily
LDFLGLTDRFLERDLEDAILRELETFLLELGAGFSFVASPTFAVAIEIH